MEAIKNGLRKNLTPAQLWSGALVIHIKVLTLNAGKQVARTMERPVVPPNTKWLGAQ